jgi:hypothetical protein
MSEEAFRQDGPTIEPSARSLIDSRGGFLTALREAFSKAADQGCRELFLCDADYAQWPLGEIAIVEEFTRWAYAHRKLVVYAHDFDEMPRRHARWVQWRRQWAHVVECRALPELEPLQVPVILLASGVVTVRLFDPVRYRGTSSALPMDMVAARETLDAVAQRSVEAFPATTLGL